MPAGRPTEPVPQNIADEIVEWISEGKTLKSYCRQDGKPSYTTAWRWTQKDAELAERIACAREAGHDSIADECIEIIDSATDANLGKARVWTRLQLLAKWNPKKYGDRTVLAGDPDAPLVLAERLSKARARK